MEFQLKQFEAELAPRIREALLNLTAHLEPESLRSAVRHLLGSGKLFRPLLALAVIESIKGPEQDLGRSSTAIHNVLSLELVHTFTLIHDDLPCMDDADLRRGLPTVHKAYGEALAVLAGDDLLALAFEHLTSAQCEPERTIELVRTLAGVTHIVVQGQVIDLTAEGQELSLDELVDLHGKKTGTLIAAACIFGAVLAGSRTETSMKLGLIGRQIGLAFQIRDDLLSLQSDEASMGKTLSTDIEKQKSTFPRLLGVDGAQDYARELVARIEQNIDALELPAPELLKAYARLALERSS